MQTFDQSLFHLFQAGHISMEEALHNASNVDEFRMRVAGILSAGQAINGVAPGNGAPPAPSSNSREDVFVKH
jgi:hypothetical protein